MPRKRRHVQRRLHLKRERQKRELENLRRRRVWQGLWQSSWNVDIRFDTSKSLEELEGENWGDPPCDGSRSPLAERCLPLRRTPLKDFAAGDLRVMIGQNIGLPFLVPLAIRLFKEDPLVEGDFYPGDLLASVLCVEADFWRKHPDLRRIVEGIVQTAMPLPEEVEDALKVFRQLG